MIRVRLFALVVILAWIGTWGCDVIQGPKRANTGLLEGCTLLCDSVPSFSAADEVQRVLLEDFTGFQCGNCPYAAVQLQDLRATHGDLIVPMKLHVGPLAAPTNIYPADYRTPVGTQLDATFGMSSAGVPRGALNRRSFDGSLGHLLQAWPGIVETLLAEQPRIAVKATAGYNPTNRELSLCIGIKALQEIDANALNYVVYLTESNIIGYQKWYFHNPVDNYDYSHNYMLRTALGGAFGFPLQAGVLPAGTVLSRTLCTELSANWVAENMHAVVVVLDPATNAVINAHRVAVSAE